MMRQVINVKDIIVFFNKKERQSYKMIAEIKKHYNKLPRQPITITEFAKYYKISKETIIEVMQSNDLSKAEQIKTKKLKLDLAKESLLKDEQAKKQRQLEKLEQIEKSPKRFSYK